MKGVETGKHKKEKYLEARRRARRAVYLGRCEAEKKRTGNVMRKDDQKYDVFKIAKWMFISKSGYY